MTMADGTALANETDETVIELRSDLDANELDVRLRKADRRSDVGHRELAFYLAEMQQRGMHQMLGYTSTVEYACKRLEMGRRHAQELIATGCALEELPLIDEAFCAGRLRWSRVRLLVRIAVKETEAQWLERALALPWTEFDREVATSERGRPPRKDRKGLPKVRIVVRGRLERVAYETWEVAKKKLEDETGESMTDADFMSYAANLVLGTKRTGVTEQRERIDDSIYRMVIQKCPGCEQSSMRTPEGLQDIDPIMAECIACDAPTQAPEGDPHHEDKTPKALRTRVLIRDGLACRCCRRRDQLMAHHIVWLSTGGKTKAWNLITLCWRCHALVHENLIIVTGTAPNRVRITDSHGVPLDARAMPIGPRIARLRAEAAACTAIVDGGESSGRRVTFAEVAARTPSAWWNRHRHLFAWSETTGEMKFQPGEAREEPAGAVPAEAGVSVEPSVASHRPARLAEVIGQQAAVRTLAIAAKAAQKRGEAADHVLLLGAAGLGKTTLAGALAAEVGTRVRVANGATIRDPGVLIRLLTSLADRDVVFLDEIHALPKRVMESLYEAMEDGRISVSVTDGHASKTVQIMLPKFTLVGATTELGRLPESFVSRFPIREHLLPYRDAEISEILTRAAAREALPIEAEAVAKLAGASRGGARHGLGLLRRVRNQVLADDGPGIDREAVEQALEAAGFDQTGLNILERKALQVLEEHGRPMGISRWSATSGIAAAVLRQLCEPELFRRGLIVMTARGRMARPESRAQLRAVARDGVQYRRIVEGPGAAGDLCRDRLVS